MVRLSSGAVVLTFLLSFPSATAAQLTCNPAQSPEAVRLWRALGGCLDGLAAEATVPWSDVHEIKAGNFVLYFKFHTPVTVRSDRGKRSTLREFKVALHGAMGTVEYHVSPGTHPWDEPSIRGIGIGPTAYQDRVRRTLAAAIDPQGRIKLPKASRGAGW
jgi:hypothetical protein